jgi:Leucine-rich repeat (LRR) protein
LPRLQALTLWQVTDDGIENIKGLRSLKTLELSDARITEKGLRKLSGLTRLQGLFLSLEFCGGPDDDAGRAADDVLKGLEALPQLRALSLSGSPFSDAGLEHLEPLRRLEWLELSGNGITDAGLERLGTLTTLESLEIGATDVTDAGLKWLKPLTRLKKLDIWQTRLTGAGLEELNSLPYLRRLCLDERQLTNASVGKLKALRKLRELEFYGFGDQHLKILEELPQLESLDLVNPRTTRSALKRFESKMPRCKVKLRTGLIQYRPGAGWQAHD